MSEAQTLDQLNALMIEACQKNDQAEMLRLAGLMKQHAADVKKAEAERLRKEAEELAGAREALEAKLYAAIKKAIDPTELLKLKAKGFTIVVDHLENDNGQLDPNGSVKVTGACKLMVPAIKAKRASSGGGGTGVTLEQQTGMKRAEIVEKFATDEEKAGIEAKAAEAGDDKKAANSKRWAAQQPVIRRILTDHPELLKQS